MGPPTWATNIFWFVVIAAFLVWAGGDQGMAIVALGIALGLLVAVINGIERWFKTPRVCSVRRQKPPNRVKSKPLPPAKTANQIVSDLYQQYRTDLKMVDAMPDLPEEDREALKDALKNRLLDDIAQQKRIV